MVTQYAWSLLQNYRWFEAFTTEMGQRASLLLAKGCQEDEKEDTAFTCGIKKTFSVELFFGYDCSQCCSFSDLPFYKNCIAISEHLSDLEACHR